MNQVGTCSRLLQCWLHTCRHERNGCSSHELSDRSNAYVWPVSKRELRWLRQPVLQQPRTTPRTLLHLPRLPFTHRVPIRFGRLWEPALHWLPASLLPCLVPLPPSSWLPRLPLVKERKRLGVTKSPQGCDKIPLVLDCIDSRLHVATISGGMHVREPRGCAGSYSKRNSQISLCTENQRASPAQSRLPWRCSGLRGSHRRSWRQPCLHFAARCQWLRLPECCSNRKRCEVWDKASCSQASSPGGEEESVRSRGSSVPSPLCALAPAPAVLCLGRLSPQKTSSLHLWFSPSSP